jgi:Transcriptional regulator
MRDERRQRILETARSAFAEEGFAGTSMAGIAQSVGMAAGTIYNYFPSKEALLVAVFERELSALAAAQRSSRGVGTWARGALKTYARFPRERWREFMAAFYAGAREDGLRGYSTQASIVKSLGRAIDSELGPAVHDRDRLLRILFSIFYQGFLRWMNAGKGLEEVTAEVAGDLEAVVEAWR